ncbi:MAG: hypothetical protein ACI94Y_000286 [Maribacter sp.]|jgi:hypothetical protein
MMLLFENYLKHFQQLLLLITNIILKEVKYTNHNLKKIQGLLEELGYVVRYEKGNFQSGYCIVENRNIIIVNKFFDIEGRINVLLDILSNVGVDESTLTEGSAKLFQKLITKSDTSTKEEKEEEK